MVERGEAVGAAARRHASWLGEVVRVERLDGGYSWRTYRVDGPGGSVVVRVAPKGGTVEPYDPDTERRALAAGNRAVPAPEVLAVEHDPAELGAPYGVHTLVPGRVLRTQDVTEDGERDSYRAEFVRQLAALHRKGDVSALDEDDGAGPTTVTEAIEHELDRLAERFERSDASARAQAVVRWLLVNRPISGEPPVVCHGDYRFGNIAWTGPGEVGGVLDWERAWAGDPMIDIAFTRLWSGWCTIGDGQLEEYEHRSGRRVDTARIAYGHQFELARSYASSLLGRQALRDGRSDDPRLQQIGDAGERGLAELAERLGVTEETTTESERNHAPH
jgi:aminoglycoside phosphotransferase (APT) family kinase protein